MSCTSRPERSGERSMTSASSGERAARNGGRRDRRRDCRRRNARGDGRDRSVAPPETPATAVSVPTPRSSIACVTVSRSITLFRARWPRYSARSQMRLMTRGYRLTTRNTASIASGEKCTRSSAAAGDAQPVRDVSGNTLAVERLQTAARGHALVELAHLRQLQLRPQLELADQHDLQQLLRRLEVGQDANLFEQRRRQILRLVDDEHRKRLKRHQRLRETRTAGS